MKITLKNLQKQLPIHSRKIKKLVLQVLSKEKVRASGWINICFVDDQQIKKFNNKFLKVKGSTDVLAFDLGDKKKGGIILADIMISTQTAIKHAQIFKTTPDQELSLYVVHGVLHILGFRDHAPKEIKLMRKKESLYVH